MIHAFKEAFEDRDTILRREKEQGKKIIGWVCTYVPEEIFYAAGFYPVRIFGGKADTTRADAYLYSNICSFARSCLEEGFRNYSALLDGFVAVNSCDHIRRLYDVWKGYLPAPFTHILSLPHKVSGSATAFYTKQLARMKEGLEATFSVKISEERLREAIALYNTHRRLLKELYSLRKSPTPPISGSEVMEVVLAGMVLPKEQHNEMLRKLLAELKGKQPSGEADGKPRILVSGSELDEADYIRTIEDLGGLVVADDLCNGTRYFWDLVDEQRDPLEALAQRYLAKAPCARMRPAQERMAFIRDLIQEFQVDGVVYETLKFCDLYGEDYPILKENLDELQVPVVSLDREHRSAGVGQTKTRVQAFLEKLGG
ncbi:MAG: 2-hydroxyacyl-CoA dehydratase [Candidatus Tectomicrobia bacterium]|uniref:2-hydroxyacyl-CoA dehydratase n=1 Tax=Tectimicrobiota bacterium TaxID=2528274 RepID=A0A932FY78_UNCTE|nr:2-hydroxyacyl-CoA dehydratase [Candidatus Tectomicrobia bacterium]